MTVYDEVNNLAKAIRDSKEYKEYKTLKDELMKTPELKAKVDEFEKIRYEEQLLAMQGEQQSAEKMKKLQELYEILVQNPNIKELLEQNGYKAAYEVDFKENTSIREIREMAIKPDTIHFRTLEDAKERMILSSQPQ